MNNDQRTAIYLRDRAVLTPAQARRVRHRARAVDAVADRRVRRAAKRDVLRAARQLRADIRARFSLARSS